nr:hypothetical protein [Tanacetum cinerariifolium]
MSWYSRCSWCGGPFNGRNCRHCTNVSFEDELVYDSNLNSYNQTPDFSYPPSPLQTSSSNKLHCFGCGDPLEEGELCQWSTCKWCGYGLREGFCWFCTSSDENSSINAPNPNSFNDPPNVFTHPSRPQYESNLWELCGNDSHYGYDCPSWFSLVNEQKPSYNQNLCQLMNQNYFEPNPSYNSNYSGFDQPPQYSIDHQEDLNQQKISNVHDRWDKLNESQNELLNMMQSFCEMREKTANLPLQEMSIQDIKDLKQQYLDEMKIMINQNQIEDYRNERIDIHYKRECKIKIDELKKNFNGMSIEINKKKELQQLEQATNLSTYSPKPF